MPPTTPKDTAAKPAPVEVAEQLAALAGADLQTTLVVMAGVLGRVRENTGPDEMTALKPAADALRLEMDKWRRAVRAAAKDDGAADPMAALLAAGRDAAGK